MGTYVGHEEAWVLPARPAAVGQARRRTAQFAAAAGASDDVLERIAFAVSEAVTNSVLHAYGGDEGEVRVSCQVDSERIIVRVEDQGSGIGPRQDSPGIGHGLTIVGALAQTLDIAPGRDGRGTLVTMGFGSGAEPEPKPGLEVLCALAVESVADASCLDVVQAGVLRRVAAEVPGEPKLTRWLRGAMPPAKPGTATWSALREGGARLVVHNPSVPRSPSGIGERLNLAWWVAIALQSPDGAPSALWGFGGRGSGRPVPSEEVIRLIATAAKGDLAQPAERALLRAQVLAASPNG